MEGDVITLQDLFTFDYAAGRTSTAGSAAACVTTGLRPQVHDALANQGVGAAAGGVRPSAAAMTRRPP